MKRFRAGDLPATPRELPAFASRSKHPMSSPSRYLRSGRRGTAEPQSVVWWSLLLIATLVSHGCQTATDAESTPVTPHEQPPFQAVVTTVQPQIWPTIVRTQGSLVADEVTTVGAKVAGRVTEVNVDLGDKVQQGDSLVALDREEFRLAVAQAEAQLAQARAAVGLGPDDDVAALDPVNAPPAREAKAVWDEAKQRLNRLHQLHEQNAASSADVEQSEAAERVAEARYASAQNGVREKIALIGVQTAELALARQRLQEAETRAPFDGFVRNRQVAPGTYVQIGQPLVELVRTSTLRFRGAIPERYAQTLRIGQAVTLRVESIPEPCPATVTRVSPALDEVSRSLEFESLIDNQHGQLRAGLFAEAEVVLDETARQIVVPASAVVRFAGVEKVWTVADGTCAEVVVRVGRENGTNVEILEGLAPGDVILVDGSAGRVARVTPITKVVAKGA
jgi:RND family efflux transporter MFP subunit